MSDAILPTIDKALIELGITLWELKGTPTNEDEFLSMFRKEMSNNNGKVVYSTDPSDFGVTWSEVKAKQDSLQSKWDEQAYARNRKADYPDWGTQLNKIYDDGITKWKSEMVDPVKAKWPKDNSGPVE